MDVSGVDVDFLNDEEILELCSDIVDTRNEEISVLKEVDVNNLSDDKIQDVYDDVIYGNQNSGTANKVIPLTEQQVLGLNYNIVDMDSNEIALLKGQNIDFDTLSEDEILSLYNDVLDADESILIASEIVAQGNIDEICTPVYYYNSTYETSRVYSLICYDSTYNKSVVVYGYKGDYIYSAYRHFDLNEYPNLYITLSNGYYAVQYGKYTPGSGCTAGTLYNGNRALDMTLKCAIK